MISRSTLYTIAIYRGQAKKWWIYPKIGTAKFNDFKNTAAPGFQGPGRHLSKAFLVKVRSMLARSIRRA